MEIKHADNTKKGKFFIESAQRVIAEMTYVYSGPGKIIIDHTIVVAQLKGQGAGKKLVEEAVKFARANKLKIFPLCHFAKSIFDKTPEMRDVLNDDDN